MLAIDYNFQDPPSSKIVEERQIVKKNLLHTISFSKAGIVAGIIKIPPKEERTLSYNELPRTNEDEKKIEDLITTLGLHGKLDLLLNHEKRLRKIGDDLRYLHPLKFIGYIFSHKNANGERDLKAYMKEVFDDYFKKTNFLKDFSQTMDIYDLKNKLTVYVNDFAKEVNVPADKIMPWINQKDWEGLLKFLTNY